MDVSPYRTQSCFPCWEVAQNQIFSWNWRVFFVRTDMMWTVISSHIMTSEALPIILIHLGKGMAVSSSNLMNVSPYSSVSHFLRWEGDQNLIFCIKLKSCFWQKWHGVNHNALIYATLPESPLIIIIHLMKVTNHSSSSEYLSLPNIIPIHVLKGCQISVIVYAWTCRVIICRNDMVSTIRGSRVLSRAPLIIITIDIEGYKTLNQQWMSLLIAHNSIFHIKRVPKI